MTTAKYVLRASLLQYQIPVQHLLNLRNKEGKRPQEMTDDPLFKAEIEDVIDKLVSMGPTGGNSLLNSYSTKRKNKFNEDLKQPVAKPKRVSASQEGFKKAPGYIKASQRNYIGDAYEQFVEHLKNEYEERKFKPNYNTGEPVNESTSFSRGGR